MQTKYTPGPWQMSYDNGSTRDIVASPDPLPICAVRLSYVTHEQYAANARLIAAAPEMAELLRELRDYVSCIPESAAGGDDVAIALTRNADALLARIDGGAE